MYVSTTRYTVPDDFRMNINALHFFFFVCHVLREPNEQTPFERLAVERYDELSAFIDCILIF